MNYIVKSYRTIKTRIQIGGTTPKYKVHNPNKCLHTLKYNAYLMAISILTLVTSAQKLSRFFPH
jgi:hypothetical protein